MKTIGNRTRTVENLEDLVNCDFTLETEIAHIGVVIIVMSISLQLPPLPINSRIAAKVVVEFLVDSIWPTTLRLRSQISSQLTSQTDEMKELLATGDVFALCCSQIQKCVLNFLEIFQTEYRNHVLMLETRNCLYDRLFWCLEKLQTIEHNVQKIFKTMVTNKSFESNIEIDRSLANSMFATPIYFVNWIDQALKLLTSMSALIYQKDIEEVTESYDTWVNEVVDCVSGLHTTLDELLLSAMTISRYCLPDDQNILSTRCRVVLRETKKLIGEIVQGDMDKAYSVSRESLKLPLKHTNINIVSDVLKDTLYILESNTNTALLALLVHCFSDPFGPLKRLQQHNTKEKKYGCICPNADVENDCLVVKEFDFYNERLMQIGAFSISCSSDVNRTLSLKTSLASLEALDPHLVPATLLTPDTYHSHFLALAWMREVTSVRNTIFLIVDPAAFVEKAKEILSMKLLNLIRGEAYVKSDVCAAIGIGDLIFDFIDVYKTQEPEALVHNERLEPLLNDLKRVLKECKTVNNFRYRSDSQDFTYEISESSSSKRVTFDQVLKRLRLLYTIVNRIHSLYIDHENTGTFVCDQENTLLNSDTHTIVKEKPPGNVTRTPFARDLSAVHSPSRCIVSKMAKKLNMKSVQKQLSFSIQLEDLFNDISKFTDADKPSDVKNRSVKNSSILYDGPFGLKRDSMRKKLMKTKFAEENVDLVENRSVDDLDAATSVMDSDTQLQITEILDQLSNLSRTFCSQRPVKKTIINVNFDSPVRTPHNILTLTVNGDDNVSTVPVNQSVGGVSLGSSEPSDMTTFERLKDIDLLDNRLNELRTSDV